MSNVSSRPKNFNLGQLKKHKCYNIDMIILSEAKYRGKKLICPRITYNYVKTPDSERILNEVYDKLFDSFLKVWREKKNKKRSKSSKINS